jgi:NADH:ubiquinone oxidoreductase subunit 3 (subunit A)
MIELLLLCLFDTLEYSWVKATIDICTLTDYYVPTLSWRSCEDEVEDEWIDVMGYIGLFYPYFTIFVVLDPRVFYSFRWTYKYDPKGLSLIVTSLSF